MQFLTSTYVYVLLSILHWNEGGFTLSRALWVYIMISIIFLRIFSPRSWELWSAMDVKGNGNLKKHIFSSKHEKWIICLQFYIKKNMMQKIGCKTLCKSCKIRMQGIIQTINTRCQICEEEAKQVPTTKIKAEFHLSDLL